MSEKDFKNLTIILKTGTVHFLGRYRRDLEKTNWHYYDTQDGDLFHFRKDQMVGVLENAKTNAALLTSEYGIPHGRKYNAKFSGHR